MGGLAYVRSELSGTGGGLVNLIQTVYLAFNRAHKVYKLGLSVILGLKHRGR